MNALRAPEPGIRSRVNVPARLSVVTVVKNDRDGLLQTLMSLREQDDQDFEWVIVDGASTDGTAELIPEIATASTRWRSAPDRGIYDAMNHGVMLATGSHLLFLNAGDRLTAPTVVSTIAARLHPDLDLLFGDGVMVLHDAHGIARPARAPERSLWRGLPAMHQATVFSRDALTVRPYDPSYAITGDYEAVAGIIMTARPRHEMLHAEIAEFQVGGTSFRRPLRLLIEADRVRREVLKLGLAQRLIATGANAFSNVLLWTFWLLSRWSAPARAKRASS
jgi:putative colanic acid biosynthesis glycosyltransferase